LTPAVPGPASPVAYSSYGAAPIESSPYDDDRSDGRYDGPRRRRHWD
jgi:hypothetical protein